LTGDVRDAESFKMRRGRVGGYPKYLSEGQQYAANAPTELDPWFGYSLSACFPVIPALPGARPSILAFVTRTPGQPKKLKKMIAFDFLVL
jgi:hypothetical protein